VEAEDAFGKIKHNSSVTGLHADICELFQLGSWLRWWRYLQLVRKRKHRYFFRHNLIWDGDYADDRSAKEVWQGGPFPSIASHLIR
jgi:hypothetical protein